MIGYNQVRGLTLEREVIRYEFLYDSVPELPLAGSDLEWADRVRSEDPSPGGAI
jgi:hypothetical protein